MSLIKEMLKLHMEDQRRGNEEEAEVVAERNVLYTVVPSISLCVIAISELDAMLQSAMRIWGNMM